MTQDNLEAIESSSSSDDCHEFHIVGVGASAGGLEALEQFFEGLPADTGMAFVVIQHLSPDFKSHMEELLARKTRMKIRRVEEGMAVEPDSVYLIPPGKEMVINDRRLLLTDKDRDGSLSHPIDQFFRSLASDVGRYSVGIILSGTGSDGSHGIQDIHDAGGLVLCQDEQSAKFNGMPMNAQATGTVDAVFPPDGIAEALVRYVKEGLSAAALGKQELLAGLEEGIDRIFQLLHQQHGIDFSHYKSTTVGRRIQRRIDLGGITDLDHYVEQLNRDPGELNELYKDLLIGVTKFFRDPEAFDVLARETIPPLFASSRRSQPIRVWVAGCASGEEAYSVAILLDEEARRRNCTNLDIKIFATDAHTVSLSNAAKGQFSEDSLSELSWERRDRYFRKTGETFQVTQELRRYIVFAPHNLINDAPFTQMDLVTCRNMLIYLQLPAQKKVLSMFHFALKSGGTMFMGPSESPGELIDEFQIVDKHWRIYKKRRDVRLPLETRMPFASSEGSPKLRPPASTGTGPRVDAAMIATYDRLLDRRMPPSILVDQQFEILHIFSGAERFLQPRGGRPTSNVLECIAESLRTSLAGALQHGARKQEIVRYSGIKYASAGETESLRLQVEPIDGGVKGVWKFLIEFQPEVLPPDSTDEEAAEVGTSSEEIDISEIDRERISSLESELRYSQENLQATVEEMETSNEELQATNEELIASNEELQSTNEELHSVNEELYTVNAEHQRRVEELGAANDDMDNLLATTRVGVVFLDTDLHIRRFTPEIARFFHLMTHDIGRSIEGFTHNLMHDDLTGELRTVLETEQEREFPADDRSGNPYLVRILPYRSAQKVDGVVLTLIDIRSLKDAEAETARFKFMTEAAANPITLLDKDGRIVYANGSMSRSLGYSVSELRSMSVTDISTQLDRNGFLDLFNRASQETLKPFESEWKRNDGSVFPIEVSVSSVVIEGERFLSENVLDITERRNSEQEMRTRQLAIESAMNGILITDATSPDNKIIYTNPGFSDMTGYSHDEVVGQNCRFLQGNDTDPDSVAALRNAIANGLRSRVTLLNYRKDGKPFWNDLQITPVFDERRVLKHFVGVQHDVTHQVESEASSREHAERITGILNATAEGIYGINPEGICTFCNATAVRLLGYDDVADLVDENMHHLIHSRRADGSEIPEAESAIYEAIKNNVAAEVDSEVFWRKDGTSFQVEYRCQPVLHDGRLTGAVISFKDITDQRRTQKKLEAANRAARKASKTKSEFLANMSHELRTPMTAVLGFSEMLRSHSSDAAYLEKVDTIRRNGEYLLSLLNDILDLSKIEAGKMDVKSEPIDVAALIEDVRSLMDVRAAEEGIPLTFEYAGEIPRQVTADRIRVRQILVNLIGNALKFTDQGEVCVTIGIVDHPHENPQLGIEVRDTGIGMSEEQVSRLFKPFSQATADTAQRFGGTGLGLSISKQLAERMRGTIAVESEAGRGSQFTLRLPITEDQLQQTEKPDLGVKPLPSLDTDQATVPQLEARILLADDRRDVWRVARFFLEKSGANVDVAEDGRQAVDAVNRNTRKSNPFDLILMDMQMPIMTGQEAVAELRQQGCNIPIIALTADAMEGERDACIAIGCDDYSPKPIDGPALVRMVADHLQRSRQT